MRTASSSVTVTCPVMGLDLKQSAMAGTIEISYIIHGLTQTIHGLTQTAVSGERPRG
jgi:hypothetical protein